MPSSSPASRWLLLLAVCLTGILTPLSFTGPAVVLPSIQTALGGSTAELKWVMNAYILTYGSAMMAAGSLADIYGRRRAWLAGLVAFMLLTAAIPHAPSVLWIDVLRFAQGFAGALAFAGGVSALAQVFEGADRPRAFSILGTCFGVALAFGPLVAGWIVDIAGWTWVFHGTAIVSVAGLTLAAVTATESRDPAAQGLDWPGAISFTAFLTLVTFGLLLVPQNGWSDPAALLSILGGFALLAVFVVVERRTERPMLDLTLFANARFVGVQVLGFSPAFFYIALIVMLPARFIGADGMGALEAGQAMIALSAPLLVVPLLAGFLSRWTSPGILSGVGLLILAFGLFLLAGALSGPAHTSALVLPMLVVGMGIGLPWGLMDSLAVSVVEKERAGMATGIFNAIRVSADGIALAVLGALLALVIGGGLAGGVSPDVLAETASRAAIADLAGAASLAPGADGAILEAYRRAFHTMLVVLALASTATAAIVFALLGRVRADDTGGTAASHA